MNSLDMEVFDGRTKGVPGTMGSFRLSDVAGFGWNLRNEDLPLPLLVLRREAVQQNLQRMQRCCAELGVELAPHGKTTMAPQIFAMQMQAGAWAITAATTWQLQVYRHYGIQRILFANQLIGRANLDYVGSELVHDSAFDFYCFVDSVAGVQSLNEMSRRHSLDRPINVLIEVGFDGGRTGIRNDDDLATVVAAIEKTYPRIDLRGVAGYEIMVMQGGDPDSYLDRLSEVAERLFAEGRFRNECLISAGGSAAFDRVCDKLGNTWKGRARVILRSGCYVAHDDGIYADLSPLGRRCGVGGFRAALELWSYVQSTPERGVAWLAFGKRDAPMDCGFPLPLAHIKAGSLERVTLNDSTVVALNDQHARMSAGSADVRVGDIIICGISHPCTAFDRWSLIYEIDEDDTVIGAVRTFF